jgi:hypothetical protein
MPGLLLQGKSGNLFLKKRKALVDMAGQETGEKRLSVCADLW